MSPDVTIATPTYDGTIVYETLRCMDALVKHSQEQGLTIGCWRQPGPNLLDNRNTCVNQASKYNSQHIFFIDADMIFPKDTLVRLLSRKVDIVGALYFNRSRPFMPNAAYFRDGKWEHITSWHQGLMDDLDGIGTGLMLVNMEVFEKILKPHWQFPYLKDLDCYGGEDYYFCQKAKEHGYKIHLDASIKTGHMGRYPFSQQEYEIYRQAEIAKKMSEKNIILPGEVSIDQAKIH